VGDNGGAVLDALNALTSSAMTCRQRCRE